MILSDGMGKLFPGSSRATLELMIRAEIRFTADDYRTLPETGPRYQLIDGELIHMSPAPSFDHQRIVLELAIKLAQYVRENRLGELAVSPIDVYLSDHDVIQPDILFVSEAREKRSSPDGVHGAPDLIVEVLSPTTRDLDLGAKKVLYARHGVTEYWVVDLDDQTISVYDFDEDTTNPKLRLERDATLTSDVLPGFALLLEELFSRV